MADIAKVDCRAVHLLDRDVVELLDRRGLRVHAHNILAAADLRIARGHREVLGVDRVGDVGRREAVSKQRRRVDVHHDLAVFSAIRRRQGQAGDRGERLANPVQRIVIKLLLVQRVGRQAELQDGHARRVVLDDDRRLDAGRHAARGSSSKRTRSAMMASSIFTFGWK